jgi:PDZ domain
MAHRILTTLVATSSLLLAGVAPGPARADNPMGYRLLSSQEAEGLPRNHGALGLDVERAQRITDSGMTFDIMRVKQVRRGSPGAQAGFQQGDQIIAVNGRVFPTIAAFAAYVGAMSPGTQATVDYIPTGGGPAQAQRVSVTVGGPGRPAQPSTNPDEGKASAGLSTGTKVAIGVGAAALLGCYEMGCFSRKGAASAPAPGAQPLRQPGQPAMGQYQR